MTVSDGPKGPKTKILKNSYPVTEGTDLGTTKISGRQTNLVAETGESRTPEKFKKGLGT